MKVIMLLGATNTGKTKKKTILTTLTSLFVTISAFAYSGGSGLVNSPYRISSKADMQQLATEVNGGKNYSGAYFILTRDLTGVDDVITTTIGNGVYTFCGIFDGGGYEIKVNTSAGIFGNISGATIKNLGVAGSVTGSPLGSTYSFAGGICGSANNSMISNCHNTGNISAYISPSSAGCPSYSGGICGYAASTIISNCYNTGNISASATSLSSVSTVSPVSYSGGICGYNTSLTTTIINCYNTGNISASAAFSYYPSFTTTTSYSGGICGFFTSAATISNCYNTGNISASAAASYSGGICGYNYGKIQNCFVSNCQITNNNDDSLSKIGRIGGYRNACTNCYADISVSVNGNPIENQDENSKNGKDILTANFQNQSWLSSILQWDFNTVWEIKPNEFPVFIKPAAAVINLILPEMTYGEQVLFAATSNNNIPIVYESSDNSIAEITQGILIAYKAGTVTITASQPAANGFSATQTSATLTVQKKGLVVTANPANAVYGDAMPQYSCQYSGFVFNDNEAVLTKLPTLTCPASSQSNAGAYTIVPAGAEAANYTFTYINGTLTITKAPLTITAESKQREQGKENPPFTLLYSGFKNNENKSVLAVLPTISCEANINSPVGFYDIVLSGGSDNNYNYTLLNGKLKITAPSGLVEINTSNISIYPNPAKDYLFIQSDYPVEKVEIYNQSGVCVLKSSPCPLQRGISETLDVSGLASGSYLARIYVDGIPVVKKIVIKK
ncbi:MAG: T9SS type A sorting domain-containing protein [Candidatus Azobacteroides sp.]|nr:T9SS type A sorting domain-containing protein [Candidatus Azobacteroides sp.]